MCHVLFLVRRLISGNTFIYNLYGVSGGKQGSFIPLKMADVGLILELFRLDKDNH